jgi:XTP/dITP diphosphohydrolase
MAELLGVPESARTARYRCVLAAARDGKVLATGAGFVEGNILSAPRGAGGFGYDPYFAPEGTTNSMAEVDSVLRLQLSHRGRALRDLLAKLRMRADLTE